MRLYRGIDTRVKDMRLRFALEEIDTFLRELNMVSSDTVSDTPPEVNANAQFLVLAHHGGLSSERRLVLQSPLTGSDGGANGNFTMDVLTGGTPAALAGTAADGSGPAVAFFDHVHLFPTTLRSTGTVTTLALTSSAAATNILTSSATTNLDLGGPANIRPTATNTTNLGTAARRWLSIFAGTNGITSSGAITSSSGLSSFDSLTVTTDLTVDGTFTLNNGYAGHFFPTTNATSDLGDPSTPLTWRGCYLSDGLYLKDSGVNFYTKIASDSSADLSADRTLTLDLSNADRTLHIDGEATISQNYSTAGEPQFTSVQVLDSGTAFYLKLASNSAAPGGNFSADRTLTIDAQNANRTLTISGDAHISQNYSTAGTPQFAKLGLGVAAHGTRLLSVNDMTATAPGTSAAVALTDFYGTGGAIYLSTPTTWVFITDGTTTYKMPAY